MDWDEAKSDPAKKLAYYAARQAEILDLATSFETRLNPDQLRDIRDYVSHNELGMALHLIDHFLCEDDVTISVDEYDGIVRLSNICGEPVTDYLKTLVSP